MASDDTIEFKDDSVDEHVAQANVPVVVDFWGENCQPCKALAPVIDSIASEYKSRALVGKINIHEHPRAAAQFGIGSIPTVVLFHNGEITEKFVGVRPEKDFKDALDKLIGQTAG